MKICIIGGVAGGATAAARLRRLNEQNEIILFEKGAHISFANCGLPYHVGGVIKKRENLILRTPENFKKTYRVDVRILHEVIAVNRGNKTLTVKNLSTGAVFEEAYDKLLLSPGGVPFIPDIPGLADVPYMTLRDIPDMDRIIEKIKTLKVRRALVIGGGYIGIEIAENLAHLSVETHVVEMAPQILTIFDPEMAGILHEKMTENKVFVHTKDTVSKIEGSPVSSVTLKSGTTLSCDLILVAIGVRPETTLAKGAGLKLGPLGGIETDKTLQTSDPDIYACGDAVEVTHFVSRNKALLPLAGPANKQARVAADNILGLAARYEGTQGTSIVKIFDLQAASTGLNERQAVKEKKDYQVLYLHPANHAGYYPGASLIHLKVIYDRVSGKILGAQAVGKEGVDKRIDILACALRLGADVYSLKNLELCYAPPFGAAKDPVNMIGFMAENIRNNLVTFVTCAELSSLHNPYYIDVATPEEFSLGRIQEAVNIPLSELRGRMQEIPGDRTLVVYCQSGLRSYNACRILLQNGFEKVFNLAGGYKTFRFFSFKPRNPQAPSADISTLSGCESDSPCTLSSSKTVELDLCGLQCPGPVLSLKKALDDLSAGGTIRAVATDEGFMKDLPAFCKSTGSELLEIKKGKGGYEALIRKGASETVLPQKQGNSKKKTLVVFSGDLDKAMAAFIIANGARAMGSEVTLFFTFWGLNILRKANPPSVLKTGIEKMFGWMMPRGADKLNLSKMNMLGMGTDMMKRVMKNKKVTPLPDLIQSALQGGVKLVACSMTMDIMGLKKEELLDGVEIGGVAHFLSESDESGTTLFI